LITKANIQPSVPRAFQTGHSFGPRRTGGAHADSVQAVRACPLCGSNNQTALSGYRSARLARCGSCTLVFADTAPSVKELIEHYTQYDREAPVSAITIDRYHELLSSLEPYRRGNRLLDFGSGSGAFLEVARDRGWHPYGIKFGEAAAVCAAKGFEVHEGPLGADRFPTGHFDVVTAFEVVEHLTDPTPELESIARSIRSGGALYVTTPNFGSLSRRLLRERWRIIEYPEHLNYFTTGTLTQIVERNGFRRVAITTTGLSLAELRRGSDAFDLQADEPLRQLTEQRTAGRLAKRAANRLLGAGEAGDTIKALFERI
jgi:2-polyprenyl-3-methyl-5-hydroxy-6-metoxy-1,4-benzoquinol methylase